MAEVVRFCDSFGTGHMEGFGGGADFPHCEGGLSRNSGFALRRWMP